jgi:hypothetical protein
MNNYSALDELIRDYENTYLNNIGKCCKRKSLELFKSGNEINTIKGVANNPATGYASFTFLEDDSYIEYQELIIL